MLYVPQRRIIGGRLPQDSATSEIESRELLYHSWRTPKIACHFRNIRQKKIAELLAREPVCCACKERQGSSSWAAFRRGLWFVWYAVRKGHSAWFGRNCNPWPWYRLIVSTRIPTCMFWGHCEY